MPVHLKSTQTSQPVDLCLRDIGQGGVGLTSPIALNPGETYELQFPHIHYSGEVLGRVVWCQPNDGGYAAGLQFIDVEPYSHARLVVDVCHIEFYLRDQRNRLGRVLDHASAAREWHAYRRPDTTAP